MSKKLTSTGTTLSMRCIMRGKLSDLLAALAVIMMLGIASPVMADQNDPQLDELFDALQR